MTKYPDLITKITSSFGAIMGASMMNAQLQNSSAANQAHCRLIITSPSTTVFDRVLTSFYGNQGERETAADYARLNAMAEGLKAVRSHFLRGYAAASEVEIFCDNLAGFAAQRLHRVKSRCQLPHDYFADQALGNFFRLLNDGPLKNAAIQLNIVGNLQAPLQDEVNSARQLLAQALLIKPHICLQTDQFIVEEKVERWVARRPNGRKDLAAKAPPMPRIPG